MGAEKEKTFEATVVELHILHYSRISGICWEYALGRAWKWESRVLKPFTEKKNQPLPARKSNK